MLNFTKSRLTAFAIFTEKTESYKNHVVDYPLLSESFKAQTKIFRPPKKYKCFKILMFKTAFNYK